MFAYFKNFIKHSTLYAIGNGISRGAGIILVPLYTRVLLPSEYGALEMFYVTASVLRTFLGLMIANATIRFYFEYDSEIERKRVVSTSLISSIVISTAAVLLLNGFIDKLSLLVFKSLEYKDLFNLVFTAVVLELSREISLAYLRAREKSFLYISVAVAQLFFQAGLNLYFVLGLKLGIKGILIGNMISILITWSILMAVTFKYCGFNFHMAKLKVFFKYCFPFVLSAFTGIVINNADRVILNSYTSLAVVGIYALGMKFGIVIKELIVEPFTLNFGQSRFAIMAQRDAKDIYARTMTYYVFIIMFLSLGISLFAKEIVSVIASAEFEQAYHIIPLVLLPIVFNGMTYIFQTGMLIKKETKFAFYVSIFSAILVLALNHWLIPMFGLYGAAAASLAVSLFNALLTCVASNKFYPVKYEFGRLIKIFFASGMIYLVAGVFIKAQGAHVFLMKVLLFLGFPLSLHLMAFYRGGEKNKINGYRQRAGKFICDKLRFGDGAL